MSAASDRNDWLTSPQDRASAALRISTYGAPSPSGCIEWNAWRDRDGYGIIKIERRPFAAHRVAWMLARGPIAEGRLILHRCDNRACINVEHLFSGTRLENSMDMVRKGRSPHSEQHTARLRAAKEARRRG